MIDYCTIVTDKRELELLPLHINSLKHYAGDEFNIKICVPIDAEITEFCYKYCNDYVIVRTYTQMLHNPGLRQAGFDCANRMDKLMQVCTSDWVFLSQSDIIWTGNPLSKIKSMMNDNYGMLGIWPHGCTVVNRKVYKTCHHAFWPNGGWLGRVHSENPMMIQLCGNTEGADQVWWNRNSPPGSNQKLVNIDGVDVGMLLPMEMQGYGYLFDRAGPVSSYVHIGGASFHGLTDTPGDEVIKKVISNRIKDALLKFKRFA